MAAIKILEILGTSKDSWSDAAKEAVKEAKKTVRHITGVEVVSQTAKVADGEITEYHTTCKIAFRVE
jgi:flavin-binding protein dodecin